MSRILEPENRLTVTYILDTYTTKLQLGRVTFIAGIIGLSTPASLSLIAKGTALASISKDF